MAQSSICVFIKTSIKNKDAAKLKNYNFARMLKMSHETIYILLCSLLFAMLSCKQGVNNELSEEQQMELKKKRFDAGIRLGAMLNDRDFDRAHQFIDSLHIEYPRDPQFYFGEGWVYDMQGDSIKAHIAYTKSIAIYDSLIAVKPNFDDMFNRAFIIQILYGIDAYNQELDKMQSTLKSSKDSMVIEHIRGWVFKKEEISF